MVTKALNFGSQAREVKALFVLAPRTSRARAQRSGLVLVIDVPSYRADDSETASDFITIRVSIETIP